MSFLQTERFQFWLDGLKKYNINCSTKRDRRNALCLEANERKSLILPLVMQLSHMPKTTSLRVFIVYSNPNGDAVISQYSVNVSTAVSGVTDILGVPIVVIIPPRLDSLDREFTMPDSRKTVKHADNTIKPCFSTTNHRALRYISNWFVVGGTSRWKYSSSLRLGNCLYKEAWLL